jgi:3-hydroxyisobutyrate dehydrogenase-like beta-hydroxyacid dehydrogenase
VIRAVGWIGLGDQGAPMARALAEAPELELHVWARRPAALEELAGVDYTVHDSPADLAAAVDALALCLREDSDITNVLENQGAWDALRAGTVLVNHGTGLPAFARDLDAQARRRGVLSLDAPVSGGRPGAQERRLLTMVGGDADAFEHLRPVLAHFSAAVVRAGEAGAGQTAKLINNALLMLNQRSIQETFALARDLHLDIPALVEVLRHGTSSSVALQVLGSAVTVQNAAHLSRLQVIDIDLFDQALQDASVSAPELSTRARRGAEGLPDAAAALAGGGSSTA